MCYFVIFQKHATSYQRNKALIDCLQRLEGAYGPFIVALKESNQCPIADYIERKKEQILTPVNAATTLERYDTFCGYLLTNFIIKKHVHCKFIFTEKQNFAPTDTA